jgi:Helix-turn-helix domain
MAGIAGFCTAEAERDRRKGASLKFSLLKRRRLLESVSYLSGTLTAATETISMDATTTTRALRYLTNEEAAMFLKLSPRTLDKFRVLGGGPKFRKFGRRVIYALDDLEIWANSRICESTSDENYFLAR